MKTGQRETLRSEVRNALLKVLRAKDSPASAIASAARTLLEMEGDGAVGDAPANEMSVEDLDAEIASIQQKRR